MAAGKNKLLRGCRLYVGGYDLSCDSRSFDQLSNSTEEVDITGWCETAKNYLPSNLRALGITGYQAIANDTALSGSQTLLAGAPQNYVLTLAIGTAGAAPVLGDMAYLLPAVQMSAPESYSDGKGVIQADFLPDQTQTSSLVIGNPWGVVLEPLTALTATTTGTGVDHGASSILGGYAHLHITVSSGGVWAITIEDAPDNVTYANLLTFTAAGGAVVAEHKTVSGTIDRYLRFKATRTSGTMTVFCAFTRN